SQVDESQVSLVVQGLTPGLPYFLRINDWSASAAENWGAFTLCIEEFVDVTYTIDEGSSSDCEGVLYDTGGENGNYGDNENHVFTICPDQSANGGCIVFNLLDYHFEQGWEQLLFYDGASVFSPQIGNLDNGVPNGGGLIGGVCYQVVATSGCLTVQFTSDNIINFEGFHGEWFCTSNCPQPEPLSVQDAPSAADIEAAMENPLMDISITAINCPDEALGVFSQGDNTNLGLDKGLLLTTGRAAEVANPASFFANTDWNLPGNPELDFLNDQFGGGGNTSDACIVEADVFVKTDRLAFDYVFGSDEYKQQFSTASDDLIGVLVSGQGIPGVPGLNNQENLATLPIAIGTTGQLVQIQTVNATTNWQYFRNNVNSPGIAYNGLTANFLGEPKTLVAARQVTPCQTYHVKFAIGDTDPNDDSGLFITPSTAGLPEIAVQFNTGLDYLVEGCSNVPALLQFSLPDAMTAAVSFDLSLGGTATQGLDYQGIFPPTITFLQGQGTVSIPLTVLADGLAEGTETIVIALKKNFGCGEITAATLTL
ncbi:MAG: choice-of-anchor L domain-containing protein, partial [Bacteroidota bacterium]